LIGFGKFRQRHQAAEFIKPKDARTNVAMGEVDFVAFRHTIGKALHIRARFT